MDLLKFNTDIKQLVSGAAAGAAVKAGYAAYKGQDIKGAAMEGAIMGAAITAVSPAIAGLVSKVWPDKAGGPVVAVKAA
jgi:hypothetical protein